MSSQMPIKIQVLNPCYCVVLAKQGYRLYPVLSYHKEFYIQGQYRKERKTRRVIIADKLTGKFPLGLLGRVKNYCQEFGIPYNIAFPTDELSLTKDLNVELPFKLRDYQEAAVNAAHFYKRGVITAPTGSGKTFVMASIASYYSKYNITFVVHTKTLMMQTYDELMKFFPEENIGLIGEGKREYNTRISVAMIQTVHSDLKSRIPENYRQAADWAERLHLVFVDECHHVAKFDGSYANFLSRTMAPFRIGVTATMPPAEEAQMALEAFIGPLIHEVKMEELIEKGNLATPILKLTKTPEYPELKEIRGYQEVYNAGIVNNRSRNRRLLSVAGDLVKDNLTVLMIVTRIEHGENLLAMADRMFSDMKVTFIHGANDAMSRELVRKALQAKEFDIVIASTIWKEGVDIPSLGAIINAAGGKSEIATIQTLGRGLRATADKDKIYFFDFFDNSHNYLISHFGERLCLYFDLGWL